MENYKRSITCVSSYLGKLVCTMVFKNWPELQLIFWTFNEAKALLEDQHAIPIPDGAVKNLATCISADSDFLILGDTLKNLSVIKKTDPEENMKQKLRGDQLHFIKYTRNDLAANVVAAFSMARHLNCDRTDYLKKLDQEGQPHGQVNMMSEQAKRLLTVLGLSQDGYIRLYKIHEKKHFEVFSQLNL